MPDTPVKSTGPDNVTGYRSFQLGGYRFRRDDYFAHIACPKGSHVMPVDAFLRALMRDVAWNFFYGICNFDAVFGSFNHYGTVDIFLGRFNDAYRKSGSDYSETFDSSVAMATFKAMLGDWVNAGYDPFAAPMETGSPFGRKNGSNEKAITRQRVTASRMVAAAGDTRRRTDGDGYPVNRHFADVVQDEPEVRAEKGFEGEVAAFNLFAYLSRSDVTWNPSVCSVVKDSLFCPTSEENVLPVIHGNDRVEWFVQLSDEIIWDISHRETGAPLAKVTMKAGDVAAMPANIRHQGYSPKRSMLLVWENETPGLEKAYQEGRYPPTPVQF
jgi:hypothetical protein